MKLEQKILKAKGNWRKQAIKSAIGLLSILLFCQLVIIFVSNLQFKDDNVNVESALNEIEVLPTTPKPSSAIPSEQLRQTYIDALSDYQNDLEPELDKINLAKWNEPIAEQLVSLKDNALSAFTTSDYGSAVRDVEALNQLAKTTISDSREEFEQVLSQAQYAYDADQYDQAKSLISQVQILDKTSVEAASLSIKIDKLPEILPQLEKIKLAHTEKNLDKELLLVNELLKLVPDRAAAIERKQDLINSISQRNFKGYIAQSYLALKQNNVQTAKQKVGMAKKIYPNHKAIREVTHALQKLEKNHRFSGYQKQARLAIKADHWGKAKKQLEQALKESPYDPESLKSLKLARSIIAFDSEFKPYINDPYRLSNKKLISTLESKISQASEFISHSPSLRKNTETLSRFINKMNKKITVEVISDNQTFILVRGVGQVGKIQSKSIQLFPGKYTFEGKRKGFKSKLMTVRVPFDKTSFKVTILCDEPI